MPQPPPPHKWLRYSYIRKSRHMVVSEPTKPAKNAMLRRRPNHYTTLPVATSDRFIVCLERTCSVFTTALGAELEWRHVTRVRTPATCVALVNLSAPTLVSTNPCALPRVGAGARPAGRSADQPGRPSPNEHDTRHGPLPQLCSSPSPTLPLLSSRRTEVSFGSRR